MPQGKTLGLNVQVSVRFFPMISPLRSLPRNVVSFENTLQASAGNSGNDKLMKKEMKEELI